MGVHTNSNCGCGETGSGGGTTPEQPGNEFLQNNVGRKINAGIVTIAPVANNNLYDAAVAIKVAENLNTVVLTITEIQTPVIVDVIVFTQGSLGSKKHKLFFSKGKGKYGPGGTTLLPGDFELFYTQNLLIGDITDGNAYATFVDLGNLPDGDYLSAANSAERDFIDEGQTYFITYNKDGKVYLLKFNGEPGYYGGSYPDSFILENFLPASDSDVQPEITRTDQLQNTGANGTDKYATIPEVVLLDPPTANGQVIKKGGLKVLLSGIEALWAKITGNVEVTGNVSSGLAPTEPEHLTRKDWVNGMNISVNQATAELFLKNADGTNLATINLAFLNNEGTTFYFNDVTQNLELKNDDGEVLSVVPASSFVTGLIRYAGFNGATPHNLEFKDPSNNIVATVPVGMVNVQGLVAALNSKANADGSNAVPFSNWNINAASSFTTEMFGDAYGNFLNDGETITHAVGYDSAGNRVRRYTASNFKLWLAIAITDVSGLVAQLNSKVNLNGTNVTQGSNWNININGSSAAWNSLQRSAGNLTDPPFFLTMNATENNAGATTKAQAIIALGINLKANDADVLHRTGSLTESITGLKSFTDQITQSTTQFDQTIDGTTGFTVKNKITAASLWSRGYRIANISNATMVGFGAYGSGQTLNYGYISVTANNHDAAKLKFNSVGLGIGLLSTDTPTVALDVVGAAKFTGEVAVANATQSGSAINKSQLDSGLSSAANNVAFSYVPSSGASTIAGTKTFTEAPVVPAGTLAAHAINKGQMEAYLASQNRIAYISKSATYTIVEADFGVNSDLIVYVNTSGGAANIRLPQLIVMAGRRVTVIKTDTSANSLTVSPPVSYNINGYGNQVLYQKDNYITVVCNGSDINIVSRTMHTVEERQTVLSQGSLNTSYPTVPVGFEVICADILTGGLTYKKITENGNADRWVQISSTPVAL